MPNFTIACVCPPQISIIVQGCVVICAIDAAYRWTAAASRYSSTNFIVLGLMWRETTLKTFSVLLWCLDPSRLLDWSNLRLHLRCLLQRTARRPLVARLDLAVSFQHSYE